MYGFALDPDRLELLLKRFRPACSLLSVRLSAFLPGALLAAHEQRFSPLHLHPTFSELVNERPHDGRVEKGACILFEVPQGLRAWPSLPVRAVRGKGLVHVGDREDAPLKW